MEILPPYVVRYMVIAYYIAMSNPRLSHSAALILKAISLGYRYGFDVMEVTGLPSGTVYPALRRLERDAYLPKQGHGGLLVSAARREIHGQRGSLQGPALSHDAQLASLA